MSNNTSLKATRWVSASDTLLMLEKAGYDTITAKEVLADQLREGRIKLWASEAWNSDDLKLGKAWGKGPSKSDIVIEDEVPVTVFRRSKNWSRNHKNWNWMENRFYVTIQSKPVIRRILIGVAFDEFEINSLIRQPLSEVELEQKPDIELLPEIMPRPVWYDWVGELMIFVSDDGDLCGFSAYSLHDFIDKRLAEKGLPRPSRGTTAKLAKHLISVWGKNLETERK